MVILVFSHPFLYSKTYKKLNLKLIKKKSRIWEITTLSTDADSSTGTMAKELADFFLHFKINVFSEGLKTTEEKNNKKTV